MPSSPPSMSSDQKAVLCVFALHTLRDLELSFADPDSILTNLRHRADTLNLAQLHPEDLSFTRLPLGRHPGIAGEPLPTPPKD